MNKNDANRKRKHFVPLRLDDDEYRKLKEWSAASNRTMSDYLRDLLNDSQPLAFPPIEYQEVLHELRKIGVNLNQIASKAHTLGFVDEREYKEESKLLWRVIAELVKPMAKGGVRFGDH